MKNRLLTKRILATLHIAVAFILFFGIASNASEEKRTVTSKGKTIEAVTTFEGNATGFTRRGSDKYTVGYYVNDGVIVGKNSLLAGQDTPVTNLDLDIVAKGDAFNAVIAKGKGTNLTLTGSINASDNAGGKNASDFSGLGAMIVAGDYARVNVNNMKIDTKGFVRAAVIADNHGSIVVKDSTFTTLGANPLTDAWDGYYNSSDMQMMLSPPWVLGIQGGVRAGNLLSNNPTLTFINSKVASGGWAVLSSDNCTSPVMNLVDTELEILPESKGGMSSGKYSYSKNYGSGYGTLVIGSTQGNYYGATIKGTTYGTINLSGDAYFRSSNGNIELKDADGKIIETVKGKGKKSTINSVFGFLGAVMMGKGSINVLDGTVVNAEDAVFLHKSGKLNIVADNAVLNSGSGVILQMMDNDDSIVGTGKKGFNTKFNEAPGWPSENGSVTEPGAKAEGGMPGGDMPSGGMPGGGMPGGGMPSGGMPGGDMPSGGMPGGDMPSGGMPVGGMPGGEGAASGGDTMQMMIMMMGAGGGDVSLALKNGQYKGNIFNGSGYYTQKGKPLNVSIENGANLTGAISLTETRHINESGKQNTSFTINEYYYLGHVENRNYRNKTAKITVNLKDGGKWIVTGESLINELAVENGAIEGAKGAKVVMKIDGKETPIKSGQTYSGDIVISLAK